MLNRVSRLREKLRQLTSALDQWRWAPVLVSVIAVWLFQFIRLSQSPRSTLTRQLKNLNPDATLYWGLAKNLLSGVGYVDTIRKREILPSVGHPALLALTRHYLGWTPAQYSQIAIGLSLLLVTWAVYRYTRSPSITLLALGLIALWLPKVTWLVGNVESSTVLTTAVLLAALAELYRQERWWPWGVLTGAALGVQLLARPVLLYPLHAVALFLVVALAAPRLRSRVFGARLGSRALALVVVVLVAESALWGVRVKSEIAYGDSRLVTGTYGAWPLYCGNCPYTRPDASGAKPTESKEWLKRAKLVVPRYGKPKRMLKWEARQRLLLSDVVHYWKTQPLRALHGYEWRLRQLLGLHGKAFRSRLGTAHALLTVLLFSLTAVNLRHRTARWGLGSLVASIVVCYAGLHALFVWSGIRYASPLFALLSVGVAAALHDFLVARASLAESLRPVSGAGANGQREEGQGEDWPARTERPEGDGDGVLSGTAAVVAREPAAEA